jgi:hypothetical protein
MSKGQHTLTRAAALALPAFLAACGGDASHRLGPEAGDEPRMGRPTLVAGASRTWFKTTFATAEFFSEIGCISSTVNVFIADETRHETHAGSPTGGPFLFAQITQYDLCAGEYASDIVVNAEQGVDFAVSGSLSTATLQATTTAVDEIGGEEVQVAFDLSWTSYGDRFTNTEKTISKPGGLTFSFRGTGYDATVSGTVALDGLNVTPEPATSGTIVKARYMNVILAGDPGGTLE